MRTHLAIMSGIGGSIGIAVARSLRPYPTLRSMGHSAKPVPNSAMLAMQPRLVDAYEALGRELLELAAEIVTIGMRRA